MSEPESNIIYGHEADLLSLQTLGVIRQGLLMRYPLTKPGERLPLTAKPSTLVNNLNMVERGEGGVSENGFIAGTVRMGYGHYRIAYAVATWAMQKGRDVYLHDLLNIQAPGADMIREIDQAYSFFSRLSADFGGPFEWAWGVLMSRGNINSLFFSDMLARELTSLMRDLPKDLPVVSAYPLHAQIAVHSGFPNVINLVPDNHPQHFVLAPGAVNLVQGPASYARFREMGVPAKELDVAGHWVSRELVENAVADSEARIQRAQDNRPRRILLPIGGAGAQKKYVGEVLEALQGKLREGEIRLFLNAGDHRPVFKAFRKNLEELRVEYSVVDSWSKLQTFAEGHAIGKDDPPGTKPVTIFHFESSHFAAFAATDVLMRCSDILATKPSELAFFPLPKLFLRRVGDHEAASAIRAMELGEGTVECREPEDAVRYIGLLCDEDDVFIEMNLAVIRAAERGVYDGAKIAVERALAK